MRIQAKVHGKNNNPNNQLYDQVTFLEDSDTGQSQWQAPQCMHVSQQ